jgi:hypothetical protein
MAIRFLTYPSILATVGVEASSRWATCHGRARRGPGRLSAYANLSAHLRFNFDIPRCQPMSFDCPRATVSTSKYLALPPCRAIFRFIDNSAGSTHLDLPPSLRNTTSIDAFGRLSFFIEFFVTSRLHNETRYRFACHRLYHVGGGRYVYIQRERRVPRRVHRI